MPLSSLANLCHLPPFCVPSTILRIPARGVGTLALLGLCLLRGLCASKNTGWDGRPSRLLTIGRDSPPASAAVRFGGSLPEPLPILCPPAWGVLWASLVVRQLVRPP